MVKCGLGHAVPNTVIDRPSAPPCVHADAASKDNRSGTLNARSWMHVEKKMRSRQDCTRTISFSLSALHVLLTAVDCDICTALVDYGLGGSDIQSCGYTYIPETHISTMCPIEPSKALPGSRSTVPHNLPCPPLSFPYLSHSLAPSPSCLLRRPAEKGPSSPLRLRSRCPKRNSHQTEQI